jgi:hypothetical protein
MNIEDPKNSDISKMEAALENESHYQDIDQHIITLVEEAKARPLPKHTKALAFIALFSIIFTGGIWVGYKKATTVASGSTGLSLASIGGGAAAFPGAGAGFGGGNRQGGFGNRNGGAGGAGPSASDLAIPTAPVTTVVKLPDDVAGTVVSISAKSLVIETLSGDKQTFPVTDTTKVRVSNKTVLTGVKAGDIVTVKPETDKSAKTITVVK